MKKIAIFASGSGSNAENIINYFKNDTENVVKIVFCNKPDAYVLERAKRLNVPTFVFGREEFFHSDLVLNELKRLDIDLIVLAGFLWKVPDAIIDAYQNRVINIHPALLPSYGGKGMYGMKVHEAVIAAGYERLWIICGTYLLCGIMDTLASSLRGLGYSVLPMVVSLIGSCLLRLVWIATIFQLNRTPFMLYISYPISWVLTASVHLICLLVVRRKLQKKGQNLQAA